VYNKENIYLICGVIKLKKEINVEKYYYLSESEKCSFELRMKGLTFREVGEKMGINSSTARTNFLNARNKITQYTKFEKDMEMDNKKVKFEVSHRELSIICSELYERRNKFLYYVANRVNREKTGRMEYEYALIENLIERIENVLKPLS